MATFSESFPEFDLSLLKKIDKKIVEFTETPPPPEQKQHISLKRKLRRSNTVNVSPSINGSFTSDGDVIEDSPTNTCIRMESLREIRDQIQKNGTILLESSNRRRSSLKRNNSDSLIKKSRKYYEFQQSFLNESDQFYGVIAENPKPGTETAKQILEGSEFSILENNADFVEPVKISKGLSRQKSEELKHLETPLSSQELSLLNQPIISSQDLNLLDMESTKTTEEMIFEADDKDRTFDCDSITFTQQNVQFMEEEIKRCRKEIEMEKEDNLTVSTRQLHLNITNNGANSHRPSRSSIRLDDTLNLRQIASWNLPPAVTLEYHKKGIVDMFEWQLKCLNNPKVLFENKNLVYSAPTSAGKTLVSEILMIKTVLERKKKALLILPFVSVVREKMFYLQDLLTSSGIRVDGFFGGYSPPGGFETTQVAVCTIEKANSIVNRLMEQGKLETIGIVVVDEIHLIGDANRGYILELLLAKILFMTKRFENIQIQVVTMSATLPRLDLLGKWLDAEMFVTDFRPVELNEMVKISNRVYSNKMELIRTLDEKNVLAKDQENVAQLCLETISENCSVIIFCPNKDWCEKLSLSIAEIIHNLWKSDSELGKKLKEAVPIKRTKEVKSQLTLNCPTGLDEVLGKTITYGCSFHHAGLTTEERDIIETNFKSGALKLIVATSTLSSGVNLPARRVIIRSPMFGGKIMNSLTYKQMIGRAGRTGKDTVGESILICTEQNKKIGEELVCARLINPITSCLVYRLADGRIEYNMNNLKRALLEIVAAGAASSNEDLKVFVQSCLFYVENEDLFRDLDFGILARKSLDRKEKKVNTNEAQDQVSLESSSSNIVLDCIEFLIEYEFIRVHVDEEDPEKQAHFIASRLGQACLASSLPPTDGFLLFSELQRSRQSFVLESELHAIYLVTPYSVCHQLNDIDWLLFLEMWEKLPSSLQRVGEIVGIRDSFIVKAMRGLKKLDYKLIQIHKRFFIGLALQELVNEVPISEVAVRFKVHRGLLQSLQQMAGTFAGIVTSFCNSLNWPMLSVIVSQFKDRLYFGIHHDLVDLMRIGSLNSQRARALHKNGIETLVDLARSNVFRIENILFDLSEFQSEKKLENENEFQVEERNKIRNFFVTGKVGLTVRDGAELIISEARQYLEVEMGITNIKWSADVEESSKTLKRHSTEECLDDVLVGGGKRGCPVEDSFEKKFSVDLFQFDKSLHTETFPLDQAQTSNVPQTDKRNKLDQSLDPEENLSDFEMERDENLNEEEIVNRSLILNCDKNEAESGKCYLFEDVNIIDLDKNLSLFNKFQSMVLNKKKSMSIGLCIGIEHVKESRVNVETRKIGERTRNCKRSPPPQENNSLMFDDHKRLSLITLCLEGNSVFCIDFQSTLVPFQSKVDLINQLFMLKKTSFFMFNAKEQVKVLLKVFPSLRIHPEVQFVDPKISNWLLFAHSCESRMNSLTELASLYAPECLDLAEMIESRFQIESDVSDEKENIALSVKAQSSIESCVVKQIVKYQKRSLEDLQLVNVLKNVEMPIQISLAFMEVAGASVDSKELTILIDRINELTQSLKQQIYQLHGHRFNLRSSKELAKVLRLPGKQRVTRSVLEKINNPLSSQVLQYRKLGGILNKMVIPLMKTIKNSRIYTKSISCTATGRINMVEPSIQTIAKDFEIITVQGISQIISIRKIIAPSMPKSRLLISADFCQLELRILTHFSEDKSLTKIMKSNHDVFRAIASKWNNITEAEVTETLRNDTKQICYGIVYGMGTKSLSHALKVDEGEAETRITEFHNTYPGIQKFVDQCLKNVDELGYVETITGRRRYFPHLLTDSGCTLTPSVRAQKQRQAFNTKIQGSAADILKAAILKVEDNVRKHKKALKMKLVSDPVLQDLNDPSRVELVLHLHDELMYEIPADRLKQFGKLLKSSMEGAMSLKIPLRVKLKCGPTWGELEEKSF